MACQGCEQKGFKIVELAYCGHKEELCIPCPDCNDDPRYMAECKRRRGPAAAADTRPLAEVIQFPFKPRVPDPGGPSAA